ncbi:MAG: ThuA domain-containing protein [Prolixibacteraceae bacterium]|jgi:uncharacterized protein|nr:ThuA domain-containing protein [Prolixibacteraceae bacterium]MBT6766168.1 ThuA domain-containing protein [Prolixibacteraceae bacterium]MBT7000420.1 ThuA domain-containing protein [Prolixibacteraceae bacterium]MBT7395787.1 ThuA domain-containing protein [Prolixibacteraceae bacterium]
MKIIYLSMLFTIICTVCNTPKTEAKTADYEKYNALIVNGQNNHNWKIGSETMKQILEGSNLFAVNIASSPEKGEDMSNFKPNFSDYDLVVLDYNGDEWCNETKTSFLNYVRNGGGVFILHAADNSFPKWKEYNELIGLGGWGKRNETAGPYVYIDDSGKTIRDNSPGKGGAHGPQHEYIVKTRKPNHPIMKGLPEEWLHAKDELYHGLRGPAENMTILATAYSEKEYKGTGRNEPALMTIKYGKGRIFHTIMGHASERNQAMKCAGFIVTSLRGAEWAASGKVKQRVPKNIPTKTATHLWEDCTE